MRGLRICIVMIPILIAGCGHFSEGYRVGSAYEEADKLFNQGNYQASLDLYEKIYAKDPASRDRVLFEMGIIYSYPRNERKDYEKSLECFRKLIKEYPESEYRQNSETMLFTISNVTVKDVLIAAQQSQIESLGHEMRIRDDENAMLRKRIKSLEQMVVDFAIRKGSVDRILIEKKDRRLTLFSKGEALKSYRIALGGDPVGPKERQGDNKTPEGIYTIDSRNRDSRYHLSLHISYPNEGDRKRARELGVSPGGDVMIHGIKKGFSWVGDAHADVDWTKGCVAVTDEEIEEIDKLAPNGTVVEIRP